MANPLRFALTLILSLRERKLCCVYLGGEVPRTKPPGPKNLQKPLKRLGVRYGVVVIGLKAGVRAAADDFTAEVAEVTEVQATMVNLEDN